MAIFIGDKVGKSIQQAGKMLLDVRDSYRAEVDKRTAAAAQYDASEADFATIHPEAKPELEAMLDEIVKAQEKVISTGTAQSERELRQLKDVYQKSINIYAARTKELADLQNARSMGKITNSEKEINDAFIGKLGEARQKGLFQSSFSDASQPLIVPLAPSPVTSATFGVPLKKQQAYVISRLSFDENTSIEQIEQEAETLLQDWWTKEGKKDVDTDKAVAWTNLSKRTKEEQTEAKFNELIGDEEGFPALQDEYWETQLPFAKDNIVSMILKNQEDLKSQIARYEGRKSKRGYVARLKPFQTDEIIDDGKGGRDKKLTLQPPWFKVGEKGYLTYPNGIDNAPTYIGRSGSGLMIEMSREQFEGNLTDPEKKRLEDTYLRLNYASTYGEDVNSNAASSTPDAGGNEGAWDKTAADALSTTQ